MNNTFESVVHTTLPSAESSHAGIAAEQWSRSTAPEAKSADGAGLHKVGAISENTACQASHGRPEGHSAKGSISEAAREKESVSHLDMHKPIYPGERENGPAEGHGEQNKAEPHEQGKNAELHTTPSHEQPSKEQDERSSAKKEQPEAGDKKEPDVKATAVHKS